MLRSTLSKLFLAFSFLAFSAMPLSYAETSSMAETAADVVITSKIKGLYALDDNLNPMKISVTTENGFVALSGEVNTDKEFTNAVAIAKSVDGVKSVIADKLVVKDGSASSSDLFIEASIEANLIKNKFIDPKNVKFWTVGVKVVDGVAYLSGTVDTEEQRKNVIFITESTKDVKSVNADELKIKE